MKKIKYTWQEFDKDSKNIAKKFMPYKSMIRDVYGVPRGGLVLAVKLAHLLNKPVLMEKRKIGRFTLVCDEISDTGKKLRQTLTDKKYKVFGITTIFKREDNKFDKIDYFVKVKKINNWIDFPWENE